jgi:hypothetical protein
VKTLSPIFFAFLVWSCKDSGPGLLNEKTNPYSFKIGDSSLYKRWLVNEGISKYQNVPDTVTAYSYFEIVKDTVINGFPFFIIHGYDYEIGRDSVTARINKTAVASSDSGLYLVEFKNRSPDYIITPFKKAVPQVLVTEDFNGFDLRNALLKKSPGPFVFDTANFDDQYRPIIFPLVKNSSWYLREAGHPSGHSSLLITYLGQESIQIEMGKFMAYKFTWEIPGNNSITPYKWVGQSGVLKVLVDFGRLTGTTGNGGNSFPFHSYEIFEYYGNEKINPDTLAPWGGG